MNAALRALLAPTFGLALLAATRDVVSDRALASEAWIAWKARLQQMDGAMVRNDFAAAEGLWREAYEAALRSRHWEGMVAVGDAYRRLGERAGFGKAADAKARETYLAALFRARGEGSVEGVLRAAQGFVDLGDLEVVEQCLVVARSV